MIKRILFILLCSLGYLCQIGAQELVYMDSSGVIRWKKNKQEIALFGANYCLPSACDFRAADYVGGTSWLTFTFSFAKAVLKDAIRVPPFSTY